MKFSTAFALAAALTLPHMAAAQDTAAPVIPVISPEQIAHCDEIGTLMRDMIVYRMNGGTMEAAQADMAGNEEALLVVKYAFEGPMDDMAGNPGAMEVGLRVAAFNAFMGCITQAK